MIQPLKKHQVIEITELLPPAWFRMQPTKEDNDIEDKTILRVGSNKTLLKSLLKNIKEAKETILIAAFFIADETIENAVLAAATIGKRVYVLTASEQRLANEPAEHEHFERRMADEHKALLNKLAGKVLVRTAPHFHAKCILTDPFSNYAKGWLCTGNFNNSLHNSIDLAIPLNHMQCKDAASWFAYVFWNEAERELLEPGKLTPVKPFFSKPAPMATSIVATAKAHTSLQNSILKIINEAKEHLYLSAYGFSADHFVIQAAIRQAQAGVKVTIITRPRTKNANAVIALAKAGAVILAHDKLHAKFVMSERDALIMTCNLEPTGLDTGFELGVLLYSNQQKELYSIVNDWENQFPWKFFLAANRHNYKEGQELFPVTGNIKDIKRIKPEMTQVINEVVAYDELRLDDAPQPSMPKPKTEEYALQVRYEWQVVAPKAPRKSGR